MRTVRGMTVVLSMVIVVSACGASSASMSSGTTRNTAIPSVAATTSPVALAPGFPMYKGNQGRTGELVGPGPSGPVQTLWTIETPGPIKSSPAVVGNEMFIVGGDGHVLAMDPATGAPRWTSVDAGHVGTVSASPTQVFAVGEDGGLSALAIADGSRTWHVAGSILPNHNPLVLDTLVIAGGGDKHLHAYDRATGAERWSAATGGDLGRGASSANGLVFVGSDDGNLYAFAADTGAKAWSYHTSSASFTTTAVRGDMVYASADDFNTSGKVYAVDATTGAERWIFTAPNQLGLRSASVDDAAVYVGAVQGPVYALSLTDGSVRWTFQGASESEAPISVVGDTLYFFGSDNSALAVNKTTGVELWHHPLGGTDSVEAGTTVAGGRILAGTSAGNIVAIGGANLASASAAPSASAIADPSRDPLPPIGELTGAPGGFDTPLDVAIDPKGNVWVVEKADRFAIFGPDRTFIERWGSSGSANGGFNFTAHVGDPAGSIAFDKDGGFYVNDPGNFRIQHFDKARTWISNIGRFGDGDGQFIDPYGVALGPNGDLYVADYTRANIQVFHPDGTFVRAIGGHGSGPGQLQNPIGPAVIGDSLFVSDAGGVTEFKTDGTFVRRIQSPSFGNPTELNAGPDGLIYEADWDGKIHVIDPVSGTVLATWKVGSGWPASTVQGLTVGKDGRVYAAEYKFNRVEIFRLPKE